MFAEGGQFDVVYYVKLQDGSTKLMHGLYKDNVFFTIFMISSAYTGLIIPYLKPSLKWYFKWISMAMGSWFIAGLFYELMNFTMPEVVLNNMDEHWTFIKYLIIFTFGIVFIITHETIQWNKKEQKS